MSSHEVNKWHGDTVSILLRLSVMLTLCVRHPKNGLKYEGNETD